LLQIPPSTSIKLPQSALTTFLSGALAAAQNVDNMATTTTTAPMSADNIAAALTNAIATQPATSTAAPAKKAPAKRGRKRAAADGDAEAEKENAPTEPVVEPSAEEKAIAAN